jgi:uncharacterized ferritin-like protein (DUF455 family)
MASVLDVLLQGSSGHTAKRDEWWVTLTPNPQSPTASADFQHVVAMAQRAEWQGYRINKVLTDGNDLPIVVSIEIIDAA